MPNPQPPLLYEKFFHIYNRGINGCNLFVEKQNYEYFLHLYQKYISEIADTFAWVLMPNHFHFLIRIKAEADLGFNPRKQILRDEIAKRFATNSLISSADFNPKTDFVSEKFKPENQFSNLFNAYAQEFNKKYNRSGSLFEHTFHRKEIDNSGYFRHVILYIHHNPVHHGFCNHPVEYPWSSYITCLSEKETMLQREKVIGWFNSSEEFIKAHEVQFYESEMDQWLGVN